MKPLWVFAPLPLLTLAACNPPATDADIARDVPQAEPIFASKPLPSPDTEGAIWTISTKAKQRIIYGKPGEPALLALWCYLPSGGVPHIEISRLSPADEGAGAMLALIGNGHIGRIEVDATEVDGRTIWVGQRPVEQDIWEPLTGPRQVTATVPGAGMVTLNPSALPGRLIESCRTGEDLLAIVSDPAKSETGKADLTKPESEPSPIP